ncbi:MAG: transcription-repair coupling factor [bacterium]|nr:transcription-repair coupling factor [bacterium]
MRAVLDLVLACPECRQLTDRLASGAAAQAVIGLDGAQAALLAAALANQAGVPCLYVTADQAHAERARDDLAVWLGEEQALLFPPAGRVPLELVAQSADIGAQRLAALQHLLRGGPGVIVTTGEGILERLPEPAQLAREAWEIRRGESLDRDALLAGLVRAGYEPVDPVEVRGQFAARGGLVDVYPFTADDPVRIELSGDEVDSIRVFDPASQRSQHPVEMVSIFPAREMVLGEAESRNLEAAVRRELEAAVEKLRGAGKGTAAARLRDRVEAHLQAPGREGRRSYLPYAAETVHLVDYLGTGGLLMVEEPARVGEHVRKAEQLALEGMARLMEDGYLLPREVETHAAATQLPAILTRRRRIGFSRLPRGGSEPRVSMRGRPMTGFRGRWPAFLEELGRWRDQQYAICLVARDQARVQAITSTLREAGVAAGTGSVAPGRVLVVAGWLRQGFELSSVRLVVVTESDITGRPPGLRPVRAPREGARLGDFRDLKVGDYVVHANHGIGVYQGIQTLTVDGVARDYLFIRYSGADRLYVPVEQIDVVNRYVGAEGHEPRINRLGGTEWARAKRKARESVRALAFDLLSLYARRQALPGHAAMPDGPWQADMEASFPYEETPDQLRSIAEIKADLESPRPMERLLLGDVGYGKTEVAMRAAFKIAAAGRQAAVLVPTTVLAQQHYQSFTDRLREFPVQVDLLSRLRGPGEQARTVESLRRGTTDIVIGTHRLLQEDVVFRDLGLLIVDEEHRFGVAHKERLKLLKQGVDVLTLSATPIPRTLHLALARVRDTSFIDTPPENRHPVQTYVCEYTEHLVREAVLRELARGGQVFYVHNRVETIFRAAAALAALIPEARLLVAHGQMRERELEEVFLRFVAGDSDVLVCTTIIEAGLDLPNVNTLIVEDADRLGLAQLYQLRGRVGRSSRLAYAYLTYRRGRVLTELAEKRLATLEEFTELGSGYRVALRDLELRGAGSILGAEQHGFMAAVGFDLYCRLLEEAVREVRGEALPSRPETQVEVAVSAFLPSHYVPDERQRMEAYRRMADAADEAALGDVEEELRDRFGEPPPPACDLVAIARLRIVAGRAGFAGVVQQGRRLLFRLAPGKPADPQAVAQVIAWGRGRVLAAPSRSNSLLAVKLDALQGRELLEYAEAVIRQYAAREGEG